MKKLTYALILLFFSCFLSNMINAQDEINKEFNTGKTEFNIAVSNIFSKAYWYPVYIVDNYGNIIYYTNYILDNRPLPKLSIGVKFHNKKGAFRLGTSLNYRNQKVSGEDNTPEVDRVKTFLGEIYFGHEWHTTFQRINIFYGFDVTAAYNNIYDKSEYNGQSYNSTSEYKYNGLIFGIDPLLGVNIFITKHISIGTEAKLLLEYSTGKSVSKEETTNPYSNPSESTSKFSGFDVSFGPLGFLSVNIHF